MPRSSSHTGVSSRGQNGSCPSGGSVTCSVDGTPSDSHGLSSSISSLTGSARPTASSGLSKIYRQASSLFLTRRLGEAFSIIEPLISPERSDDHNASNGDQIAPAPIASSSGNSRIKIWSLYLTLLDAIIDLGAEEGKNVFGSRQWRDIVSKVREGRVWEDIVRDGYHGVEGDVDVDVVVNLWVTLGIDDLDEPNLRITA